MATFIPLKHALVNPMRDGYHLNIAEINHDGGTNEIAVPGGVQDAAVLYPDNANVSNKPSVTVTVGNDIFDVDGSGTSNGVPSASGGGTAPIVSITGGASGRLWIVSRHIGNQSL